MRTLLGYASFDRQDCEISDEAHAPSCYLSADTRLTLDPVAHRYARLDGSEASELRES